MSTSSNNGGGVGSGSSNNRKRKANNGNSSSNKKSSKDGDLDIGNGFDAMKLEDIRFKIKDLAGRVPPIPTENFEETSFDEKLVRQWAGQLQAILEEFNLLVCCVATATYKWGTDRSGAADQNLNLLSGELASSQEQIASTVTPRLTNVLAPVVDLVIDKVVTTKDPTTGHEIKTNEFTRKLVDPDFVKLCHGILCRNATLLRHVVLSNFQKLLKVLRDYLNAQKNDSQHGQNLY